VVGRVDVDMGMGVGVGVGVLGDLCVWQDQ